jgi:anti-sigma-K factor RskA
VNIKEYISSGIVESYVLGLASEQERIEFEQLCMKYPELVEARTNIELLLEKKAMENAVPPAYSKDKIWSVIQQTASASNTSKIITMEPSTNRSSSGMRWVAAASILVALAAGYFAYDSSKKNSALESSNKELAGKLDKMDSALSKLTEEEKLKYDPNVTVVTLTGTTPAAPSANIYWDTASANVFLLVKNMPKLPSDQQYQLWSLLDGKPTSLGLFDGGQSKVMLKMNNAQKSDAFAITIEPRGNTGGPHLEQLQNMGKTKL